MSGFHLIPDPQHLNAVTVMTPGGQRIRITEYQDRRLRFRISKAAPAMIQEAYLTGNDDDVIIKIAPAGWTGSQEGTLKKEIVDTITNAKRMESIAEATISDLSGLTYQLDRLLSGSLSDSDSKIAVQIAVNHIIDLHEHKMASGFLCVMPNYLKDYGHEMKQLGQLARVKAAIARTIELWTGKNHTKKHVQELLGEVDVLMSKVKDEKITGYKNMWITVKGAIPKTLADVVDIHSKLVPDA